MPLATVVVTCIYWPNIVTLLGTDLSNQLSFQIEMATEILKYNITGTQQFVSVESLECFSKLRSSRTLSGLALQAPRKIPYNFDKPLLYPAPRRNAQVQKRNTTGISPIPPPLLRPGGGFNWLVHNQDKFSTLIQEMEK